MRTLVFIVNKLSQPRCVKRIQSLYDAGIPVKVFGFDDGLYKENLSNATFPVYKKLSYNSSGKMAHMFEDYRMLHDIYKANPDSEFYIFGYKLASAFYLSSRKNYIYEEADLNAAKKKNPIHRRIAIKRDKEIALNSDLTVYTSQGFVEYLFDKKKPRYVLLPNKLNTFFQCVNRDNINVKHISRNHIKFGFIGLVRYPNTILRFARIIAERYPQHEFHFYGDISKSISIPDILKSSNNIIFHGSFKNPQNLMEIYENIDINVACYDAHSTTTAINAKIAEPNKLYESIFFKTPIVVSKNTYVAKRVEEFRIGTAIDASVDESIIRFIEELETTTFNQYSLDAQKIGASELIDNPLDLIIRVKEILAD